jgi:hypothetical protein
VHPTPESRPWIVASLILVVASIGGVLWIGSHYWHEPDYWLVAIPGFGTAIGTIGLAGATFRLIQREGAERENTLLALKHSQTIAEQSQTAALEAARHRRDDRARLLRITHWQRIQTHLDALGADQAIQDGYYFDLPKDASRKLLIGQNFEVVPTDGHSMTATFNGFTVAGEKQIGIQPLSVPFGMPLKQSLARFTVERTVAEWLQIYEDRAKGEPGEEGHAWIRVDDPYNDGVTDSYEIVQGGCPFKKSPDIEGRWILDASGMTEWNMPQVVFHKLPMKRLYYISKSDNQPLG